MQLYSDTNHTWPQAESPNKQSNSICTNMSNNLDNLFLISQIDFQKP